MAWTIKRTLLTAFLTLGLISGGIAASGLLSLGQANNDMKAVYLDRVVPLRDLKIISDDYAVFIVDASHKVRNRNMDWDQGVASVTKAHGEIERLWSEYLKTTLTAEESSLVAEAKRLMLPADQAVEDLLKILHAKNQTDLERFIATRLYQTIDPVTEKITALVDLQVRVAEDSYHHAARNYQTNSLLASILILVALSAVATGIWVVVFRVLRPLGGLTRVLDLLAEGRFEVEVPCREARNELGEMARAVEILKQAGIEAEQLRAEQATQRERAIIERRATREDMAQRFEGSVGGAIQSLAGAAAQLNSAAESLSNTARMTSGTTDAAASGAHEAAGNVETVAAAAEELSASIREVASRIVDASRAAQAASAETVQTNAKVRELHEASVKIGDVVKLISRIANQTNLLALNATIEAARAGDAGKGFVVVASEVKALANQTERATREISDQISSIQGITLETAGAIEGIGRTISLLEEISTSVAASAEQQAAATAEITRTVTEAARSTASVSDNVAGAQQAVATTGAAAAQVLSTSRELERQSANIRSEVARFLSGIRTE